MLVTHEGVMADVRRAIASKIGDDVELTENSRLIVDIGIDSVILMDLVADLEDHFRLTLSSEDLAGIATLGDIVRTIEARLRVLEAIRQQNVTK